MIKNNLKVAYRDFTKHKLYSWIKIGGFAIGIAACFLIALYIRHELGYDKHYKNSDRIYRVVGIFDKKANIRGTHLQAPFARTIVEEFPEIEKAGRALRTIIFGAGSNQFRPSDIADNTYEEEFIFVDQSLLDILEVPFIYGNPQHALNEPNTIVLTKRKADKYYPGENPVGKTVIINNNINNPLKIGGVIENFPYNSHFQGEFLMGLYPNIFGNFEYNAWDYYNYHTYILVKQGTDISLLEKKLDLITTKYVVPTLKRQQDQYANVLANKRAYELQPINEIHLNSANIYDSLTNKGDIRFVWLFGAIALFILIIACINFINLSTAKSANRAKEVGLRKTVGSRKNSIIQQFLSESMLYSFISVIAGILVATLLLPYFNSLAGKSLTIPWNEWWFFPVIISSTVFIGFLAGLYPSFYLSSFKPIHVLKGNISKGSKSSKMRSGLVVFQFAASIILIICTMVVYHQVRYILNKKVGFNKDQVVILHGTNTLGENLRSFKTELVKLSEVQHVTISNYLPLKGYSRNGNSFWNEGRTRLDQSVGTQRWRVDQDYIKTLGIKIIEGRDFSEEIPSDRRRAAIINQTLAKQLDLDEPIGKRITNGGGMWEVIGVVEDFHHNTFKEEIGPLMMQLGNSTQTTSIRVNAADMSAAIRSITKVWNEFSPNQVIRFSFLDENFAKMYSDVQRMGKIFSHFAILAIIVACLGLYALSAFMIEQRGKEISIHMVLGASIKGVFNLLTTNFVRLILISLIISVPLSYYMMNRWLEDFAYRIKISWEVFLYAGFIAIIIALATISYQSFKAAMMNPVDKLKDE